MVCLYWLGFDSQHTHRRYPTATQHGLFELLCFQPHPVQVSLINLDTTCSQIVPISMPSSVRTPVQRAIMSRSGPNLKPSSIFSLPVAWITEPATDPSWKNINLKTEWIKLQNEICLRIQLAPKECFILQNTLRVFCYLKTLA